MSKNVKKVIYYIIFVLIFYIIFYWGVKYGNYLHDIAKSTYIRTSFMIYNSLFPIMLGLLIGLHNFINRAKTQGKWKVNWIKLVIVGMPTLYIGLFSVLFILSGEIFVLLYPRFLLPAFQQEIFYTISGFIFGYIILDSIEKNA